MCVHLACQPIDNCRMVLRMTQPCVSPTWPNHIYDRGTSPAAQVGITGSLLWHCSSLDPILHHQTRMHCIPESWPQFEISRPCTTEKVAACVIWAECVYVYHCIAFWPSCWIWNSNRLQLPLLLAHFVPLHPAVEPWAAIAGCRYKVAFKAGTNRP